jgi:hypothetical protein
MKLAHLDATGTFSPGWPDTGLALDFVPTFNIYGHAPRLLCSDGAHGVYVGWFTQGTDITFSRIKRIQPNGTPAPGWPDTGIVIRAKLGGAALYKLEPDGSGGVFAVVATGNGGYTAAVQHVLSSGSFAPGWPDTVLYLNNANSSQDVNDGVSDGAGGIIVTWADSREVVTDPNGYNGNIYAQRILGNGTRAAGWPAGGLAVCTEPSAQWNPLMCSDGAGGALVTFIDLNLGKIGVQRVRGNGTIAPGWPAIGARVGTPSTLADTPDIVSDGAGGAFVAWTSTYTEVDIHTYATHLTAAGVVAAGWPSDGLLLNPPFNRSNGPASITTCPEGAIVASLEYMLSGNPGPTGIQVQKLLDDGLVPTQVAFRDAQATPHQVTLRWWGSALAQSGATVQRSSDGNTWNTLGAAETDGEDAMSFTDRAVSAGARYAYRLAIGTPPAFTAPAWVDVPAELRFALAGARPNPSPLSQVRIEFTLARSAPGALELLDVAGRRIAWRDLSGLAPGRQVVDMRELGNEAPGLYWLRLSQGSDHATARVVLTR